MPALARPGRCHPGPDNRRQALSRTGTTLRALAARMVNGHGRVDAGDDDGGQTASASASPATRASARTCPDAVAGAASGASEDRTRARAIRDADEGARAIRDGDEGARAIRGAGAGARASPRREICACSARGVRAGPLAVPREPGTSPERRGSCRRRTVHVRRKARAPCRTGMQAPVASVHGDRFCCPGTGSLRPGGYPRRRGASSPGSVDAFPHSAAADGLRAADNQTENQYVPCCELHE